MTERQFAVIRSNASSPTVSRVPGGRDVARFADSPHPSREELDAIFYDKYGPPDRLGWSPRRRQSAGYFLPSEIYEAVVARHVFEGCAWIDVGGGHQLFPDHPDLGRRLAARCHRLAAVDPDATVRENVFATECHQCAIENFVDDRGFDLATLRMVAEHIDEPARVIRQLRSLLVPGGTVIVLTVNRWSPVSLLSRAIPFRLHHPIKRLFWGGEARDTFPVQYRLNTRAALRRAFEAEGFVEAGFAYLDDLSAFGSIKWLNAVELSVWRIAHWAGLTFPENCLLAIYRAPNGAA